MPKVHFEKRIATRYEDLWPNLFDPAVVDPAVTFLAEPAGTGPALELGIGTGRVALPLSRRGVHVHGIDLSPPMVEQLTAKPGGGEVGVTIGDFEEYDVAAQIAVSHHYWVIDGELVTFSSPHRYVWPTELDLMARLAGMTLRERWSDWSREPFTAESRSHVSVWEKDA